MLWPKHHLCYLTPWLKLASWLEGCGLLSLEVLGSACEYTDV